MLVFRNGENEISCDGLTSTSSVGELADAVVAFCRSHIDCAACRETCCAGLAVYPDHVFLSRLLQLARPALSDPELAALPCRLLRFDPVAGKWLLPPKANGRCPFLSHSNRCTIYASRPLVCRLHICGDIVPAFRQLKDRIYLAYHDALRLKMLPYAGGQYTPTAAARQTLNPVLHDSGYNVSIRAICIWADC